MNSRNATIVNAIVTLKAGAKEEGAEAFFRLTRPSSLPMIGRGEIFVALATDIVCKIFEPQGWGSHARGNVARIGSCNDV